MAGDHKLHARVNQSWLAVLPIARIYKLVPHQTRIVTFCHSEVTLFQEHAVQRRRGQSSNSGHTKRATLYLAPISFAAMVNWKIRGRIIKFKCCPRINEWLRSLSKELPGSNIRVHIPPSGSATTKCDTFDDINHEQQLQIHKKIKK